MTRTEKKPDDDRIGELEDAIKERDRRIADLKAELEEERDLTHRLAEHVEDCNDMIDSWIQAFEMVQNEEGVWTWRSSFAEGEEWQERWSKLVDQVNKFVPVFNATVRRRNVGRPLLASKTQCAEVLKLHKAGELLRGIAEETNLGCRPSAPSSASPSEPTAPASSILNASIRNGRV